MATKIGSHFLINKKVLFSDYYVETASCSVFTI